MTPLEDTPSTVSAIAEIWQRHQARAREEVERIASPDRAEALRAAHHLAGSLGVFGMPEGSELAKQCETALEEGRAVDPAVVARLRAVVADA